jgi:DNA-binding IclR family transcriptional regulator
VEFCQTPQSVAEIAVALRIPLGVARVLVADLTTEGYVTYSQPTELPIELIERIRDRVRAL